MEVADRKIGLFCPVCDQVLRAVGRAVIDHQPFEVAEGLRTEAVEYPIDRVPAIIGRREYREDRHRMVSNRSSYRRQALRSRPRCFSSNDTSGANSATSFCRKAGVSGGRSIFLALSLTRMFMETCVSPTRCLNSRTALISQRGMAAFSPVSYTHLRAHE